MTFRSAVSVTPSQTGNVDQLLGEILTFFVVYFDGAYEHYEKLVHNVS